MENNNKQQQSAVNPYLDARREWNERYGSYISRARAWQLIGFLSLLLGLAGVAGIIYFASQNKLIPYVVQVDSQGAVQAVSSVQAQVIPPDLMSNIERYQVAQFIQDVRSVSPDTAVEKLAIDRAFTHLSAAYPANDAVSEWFKANHPFKRAATETVAVAIKQVIALSAKTFRVEWVETARSRKPGQVPVETSMTATVSFMNGGKVTEQNLLHNPTGLFITDLDWQKQLGDQNQKTGLVEPKTSVTEKENNNEVSK